MPVLFGIEKYKTYYQLLHEKRVGEAELPDNDRMRFGRALEPAIAQLASDDLKFAPVEYDQFIVWDEKKIASSFDYLLMDPHHEGPIALLECKNVDALVFKKDWWVDEAHGLIAPPNLSLIHI